MTGYKAAIFDFDGTLCDTLPDICAAGNYALSQLGFPVHELSKYPYFVGEGVYNLCKGLLPEESRDHATVVKLKDLYKAYYEAHGTELTKPYDGIADLLKRLRDAGIKLAILSNKDDSDTKSITELFFGGDLFTLVLGAREGYPVKPDPAVPLQIAAELVAQPSEIIFIGDSMFDIITAKNAGMDACGVLWGFRGEEELRDAGADYIVDRVEDLYALITQGRV